MSLGFNGLSITLCLKMSEEGNSVQSCPVDINRHQSIEALDEKTWGWEVLLNQIVIATMRNEVSAMVCESDPKLGERKLHRKNKGKQPGSLGFSLLFSFSCYGFPGPFGVQVT